MKYLIKDFLFLTGLWFIGRVNRRLMGELMRDVGANIEEEARF
jgi:hypothetical protein